MNLKNILSLAYCNLFNLAPLFFCDDPSSIWYLSCHLVWKICQHYFVFYTLGLKTAISLRASVCISEKSYFKTIIWPLGRLIITKLIIVSRHFQWTELWNIYILLYILNYISIWTITWLHTETFNSNPDYRDFA